ncbi:MAG: hypothetical protein J3Q66DRAFT_142258 [Benniella sp.]|nr:MAG: hypothetical protein J3Q66DRAFT_142258 [Benniella sp.]
MKGSVYTVRFPPPPLPTDQDGPKRIVSPKRRIRIDQLIDARVSKHASRNMGKSRWQSPHRGVTSTAASSIRNEVDKREGQIQTYPADIEDGYKEIWKPEAKPIKLWNEIHWEVRGRGASCDTVDITGLSLFHLFHLFSILFRYSTSQFAHSRYHSRRAVALPLQVVIKSHGSVDIKTLLRRNTRLLRTANRKAQTHSRTPSHHNMYGPSKDIVDKAVFVLGICLLLMLRHVAPTRCSDSVELLLAKTTLSPLGREFNAVDTVTMTN